ncbi:beta-microseminoprotein, partial [Mus musculus]
QEAWLGSLLFLATMVIASKAVCSIENREIFPNQMSDDCMDADGNKHFLNTPWKKNCTWCSCDKTSITCCTNATRPLSYDKDNCDVQFHPENCTYSVVDRKNPGKTCRVDSWTM